MNVKCLNTNNMENKVNPFNVPENWLIMRKKPEKVAGFFKQIIVSSPGLHISLFHADKEKVQKAALLAAAAPKMQRCLQKLVQRSFENLLPVPLFFEILEVLKEANPEFLNNHPDNGIPV